MKTCCIRGPIPLPDTTARLKKKWLPDTRGRNTESLNYHPVTALMLFIREADPVDDRGGGEGSILTYEGRREFPRGAPCYPGFMLFISYPGAHV